MANPNSTSWLTQQRVKERKELPPLGSVAAGRGARLLSRPAVPLRAHHQGLNPSLVLSVRAQDPDRAVWARHQLRPRRLLPLRRQGVADGGREGSQGMLARQGTRPPGEAQALCLSRLQAERKRGRAQQGDAQENYVHLVLGRCWQRASHQLARLH